MSSTAANSSASLTKLIGGTAAVLLVAGSIIAGVCGTGRCKARTAPPSPSISADATALTATNGVSPVTMTPTKFPSSEPNTVFPATLKPTLFSSKAPDTRAPDYVPPTEAPMTLSPVAPTPTKRPTVSPVTMAPTTPFQSNAPISRAPVSPTTTDAPVTTASPVVDASLRITEGALVTSDCLFQNDYGYAIDIFWSCGDERFNEPLRLHTFKRHAYSHQLVFADQHLTYRREDQLLWFEQYNQPRCVRIDTDSEWHVTADDAECTRVRFVDRGLSLFWVQDVDTGLCASTTFCDDDESTGGRECGGVDHRFLPLRMDECSQGSALHFSFAAVVSFCPNERPGNLCF